MVGGNHSHFYTIKTVDNQDEPKKKATGTDFHNFQTNEAFLMRFAAVDRKTLGIKKTIKARSIKSSPYNNEKHSNASIRKSFIHSKVMKVSTGRLFSARPVLCMLEEASKNAEYRVVKH
uniref:Uncharacterized protein n=1 Tax=Romanomermis culicivorax TaxID=13658 RepID=A0A915IIB9_ROMCU